MKKRLIVYGILAMFVCAVLAYRCFFPLSGVSILTYPRIHAGMSAQEVEELLDETSNGPVWRQGLPIRVPNQGWVEYWKGNGGTISIFYDKSGLVVETEWNWSKSNFLDRVTFFLEEPIRSKNIRE